MKALRGGALARLADVLGESLLHTRTLMHATCRPQAEPAEIILRDRTNSA